MLNGIEKKEYAKIERYERVIRHRIQHELPVENSDEPDQEDDDITTLKSKINKLIQEKEALANELPTLKSKIDELIQEKGALMNELRSVQRKLERHQVACLLTVEAIKNDDV